MQFCGECFNLLYAAEDEASSRLMFRCQTCNYFEYADAHGDAGETHRIFSHQVSKAPAVQEGGEQGGNKEMSAHMLGFTTKQLADMRHDPALPRAQVRCSQCGGGTAVWIQTDLPDKQLLTFVCCNPLRVDCNNAWTE